MRKIELAQIGDEVEVATLNEAKVFSLLTYPLQLTLKMMLLALPYLETVTNTDL